MDQSVADFLNFLAVEKNASNNTIAAYRNDLGQFQTSIASKVNQNGTGPWPAVGGSHVVEFLTELRAKEYKDSTLARKIAAVKSFFGFLVAEGIVENDPTERLKSPQVGKSLPKALSIEEMDQLLEQPARKNTPEARRDKAMLELTYATGMRVSEVVAMDIVDIALESDPVTARCSGKGDKERVLALPGRVVDELRHYIFHVRPRLVRNKREPALFVNRRGERLTRQGLWLILKNYAKAAGLENVTPHTIRHSYATHMLDGGMPIRNVQEALGHASLSTTQVYTQLKDEQKRREYDSAHPRA
jgi:integrase/recombinase XerD